MNHNLKNKISSFQSEFKDEYWQAAQLELAKNKRRKTIALWWLGLTGLSIFVGLFFLLKSAAVAPINTEDSAITVVSHSIKSSHNLPKSSLKAEDQFDTSKLASKNGSNQMKSPSTSVIQPIQVDAPNSKSEDSQPLTNDIIQLENEENKGDESTVGLLPKVENNAVKSSHSMNTNASSGSIVNDVHHASKPEENALGQINEQNPKSEKTRQSPTEPTLNRSVSPISNLSNENKTSVFPLQFESEKSKLTSRLRVEKLKPIALSQFKFNTSPIASLDKIPIGNADEFIPLDKNGIVDKHDGFQLAVTYAALKTSSNKIIQNQELSLHYLHQFKNPRFYYSVGLGIGRYSGAFEKHDIESISYRSFATNTNSQYLVASSSYFISAPLAIGYRKNKWAMEFSFSLELNLAMRGKVIDETNTTRLISTELQGETTEIMTIHDIETQETTAWLNQSNLKNWTLPLGLSVGYQIWTKWDLGVNVKWYNRGVHPFKRSLMRNESSTGQSHIIKGGIYVRYHF